MMKKIKQFFIDNKKAIIITVSSLLFFIILLLFFTYVVNLNSPFVNKVRSFFPMPAIVVGGSWITINELEENVTSTRRFYENQNFSEIGVRIDFETEEGKKRLELNRRDVMNKMIEDEILERIAKKYNIVISDELVISEINRPLSEGGDREEVKKELERLYGWTFEDFAEKAVRPQLLREKVQERFLVENPISSDVKEKINQAKKELDDGRDFADVAKKYSEGRTKNEGGALGWFEVNSDQLISEIDEAASALEVNEYSDVVESPLGVHIVKVTDSRDLDDGTRLAYVNQIFIKRKTLIDLVKEEMNNTFIGVPIKGYSWDKNENTVIFTSEEMKEFEKKMEAEYSVNQDVEVKK